MDKERKIMNSLNLDGLLLTDYFNKRYFTGFTGTTGVALATLDKKYFFSDFRYVEQGTKQTAPYGYEFVQVTKNFSLSDYNVTRIGFDDISMPYAEFMRYKEQFPNAEFIPVGTLLLEARKIKTEEEIKNLRRAAEITDIAFKETLGIIKEGISEKEIAAHLEYIQRINGADDKSFETIVASGYRSSMPHGVASDKKIKRNELITMDFGCLYNGYASDMTRTVFFGDNISEEEKRIYDLVYQGQTLGIEMIKPGVIGKDVDLAVREYFKKEGGWDKYFGHSLGHSFGLEVHEAPYCSSLGNEALQANMLMTVEPGIYIEGKYGVRIEDDLLVTETGYELLTKSPRELIMIY